MKIDKLENMKNGWFVGDFIPSVYKTGACETAVKSYKKGDKEKKHFHKVATEITVIVKGKVRMFDCQYNEGDIIVVEPGEATSFEALEDTINVVVKVPSVEGDKYEGDDLEC